MLAWWIELLPFIVVRWIARKYACKVAIGGMVYDDAFPDCLLNGSKMPGSINLTPPTRFEMDEINSEGDKRY